MKVRPEFLHAAEEVLPFAELQSNGARVLQKLRETGRSVVLTEEGRPAAVLMTPEELENLHSREQVLGAIAEGLADAESGRVVSHEELRRELEAEFGAFTP